jgi:hypothetical protein
MVAAGKLPEMDVKLTAKLRGWKRSTLEKWLELQQACLRTRKRRTLSTAIVAVEGHT